MEKNISEYQSTYYLLITKEINFLPVKNLVETSLTKSLKLNMANYESNRYHKSPVM